MTIASFYASLDHWVVQLLCDLKEQLFDHLIKLNFGKLVEYEIRHKPLAEQAMEQQSNAGPGGGPRGGNMFADDPMGLQPDPMARLPQQGNSPQMMSLLGEGDLTVAELLEAGKRVTRLSVNAIADLVPQIPTEAQRDAGNYRKKHIKLHGLDIAIETEKGQCRKPEWPELAADYGYIKRTEGADGDHVDVFVGPFTDSEIVFVVDQVDEVGQFDEHKCLIGFYTQKQAIDTYKACFTADWKVGPVASMTIEQFKSWLQDGSQKKPLNDQVSRFALVNSSVATITSEPNVYKLSWVKYDGDKGGSGWKNTQTGEVRYQEEMPDEHADAVGFASPNVEENLHFEQAMTNLDSPRHAEMKAKFKSIDEALGVEHQSLSIIGDWGDGAEDSILTFYSQYTDLDELRYIMAWKGLVSDQKAVLLFQQGNEGPQRLYDFEVEDSVQGVRATLAAIGIAFRSIVVLNEERQRVVIVDLDNLMADAITQVQGHYNVRVKETRGQGEFIGVDSERSRSEASAEYSRIIREYEEKWPDRRRYSDPTPFRLGIGRSGREIDRPLVIGIGQMELAQ